MLEDSLRQGRAAYERGEFKQASQLLGRFVGHRIDDLSDPAVVETVKQYADALLRIEPVEIGNVRNASGAYRRLLRDGPFDGEVYARLALIYQSTGDAAELEYIAHQLRQHVPDDARATIWLAQACAEQHKTEAAVKELRALAERLDTDPPGSPKPPEFVEACLMLAALSEGDGKKQEWFDRAVNGAPASAAARVARARFLRTASTGSKPDQAAALKDEAVTDLERAESAAELTPLDRLGLCQEWLLRGRTDRAAAQLAAMSQVPNEEVREVYLDPAMWRIDRYRQSAALALTTGELDECLRETESILAAQSAPHHLLQTLPVAIEVLIAAGQVEKAKAALSRYDQALSPDVAENSQFEIARAYLTALVALSDGRPYSAIQQLEPLVQRPSATPSMRALLARAYEETGQHGRAAALYASVETSAPYVDSVAIGLRAVRALLQDGRTREALAAVTQLEQQYPERIELRLIRIRAELLEAPTQSAASEQALGRLAAEVDDLLSAHPEQPGAWSLKAILAQQRGAAKEAEQTLVQGVGRFPDTAALHLQLARFCADQERFGDADNAFEAATRAQPNSPAPWLAYAEYLVERNLASEATIVLQRALDAVDASQRSEVELRLAAIELADPDTRSKAIERLRAIAAANPNDIRSRAVLLRVEEVRRSSAEARRLIDEIKAIEGEETGLVWRVAQAQLELDSLDAASPQGRKARIDSIQSMLAYCITADPARAEPALLLASLYEQVGDVEGAERAYRRYLRDYSHPMIAQRLVVLLERQRRFADARAALENHWSLFDPQEASRRRVALSLAAGDLDSALEDLRLQLAGQKPDPAALLILARLVYARTQDAKQADGYVEQALAAGADPIQAAAVRLTILRADGRIDDALALAAETVRTHGTFDAHLLEADFLRAVGRQEEAEAAYEKLPALAADAAGYRALGEFYGRSGRLDECVENSLDGLKSYPDDLPLKRGLIKALVMRNAQGDREQAASRLDALGTIVTEDADLTWVKAMLVLQRRGLDGAGEIRSLIRQAIDAPPTTIEAYEGLTGVATAINDSELARGVIGRAERVHGKLPSLLLARARLAAAAGDPVSATAYLREAIAANPLYVDAFGMLIPLAARRADVATIRSVLPSLERAATELPGNEIIQIAWSYALEALGRTEDAIERLSASKDSDDGAASITVRLRLAELLRGQEAFDAAKQVLDEADRLSGGRIEVRVAGLRLLQSQGQYGRMYEEAMAVLQAQSLSAEDVEVVAAAAQMLHESGQSDLSDQAVTVYERLIERERDNVLPLLALAIARYQRGEISEAISAYRDALERSPDQTDALNNLAWILCEERQDYEQALALSSRAVELRPNDPSYRDTLATILSRLPGRLEASRDEFARAVDLSGLDSRRRARGMLKLGVICLQLRDVDAAERCLSELARVSEGTELLSATEREELARLLTELRNQ